MKRRLFIFAILLLVAGFPLFAQVVVAGDVTTIYTLGNASSDQQLATGTGDGAYEYQKNGYYAQANLYAFFNPVSYLDGYFKLYATARPGSFYVPLSLQANSYQNLLFSFDKFWARVNVFDGLNLNLPVNLYLKTGKYRSQAQNYQSITKFGLDYILDLMESDNTFNWEAQAEYKPMGPDSSVYAAFSSNYQFDEGIQRLYDDDGGVSPHGQPVLGEYAPQYMGFLGCRGINIAGSLLSGELMYGKNVAAVYSGNSFGADARYDLVIVPNTITVPIGLGFGWFEKNIDVLSHCYNGAVGIGTFDFRNTTTGSLSGGLRYRGLTNGRPIWLDLNLAGIVTQIEHIYRDPLFIASFCVDGEFTYMEKYFLGAGFVAGTLNDAEWKTKSDPKYVPLDSGGYDHTFTFADNLGYEVYAGLNFQKTSRFVVGYNQNKGIAINYNLENKPEGQYKYKLPGTNAGDGIYETGGLYVKFIMSW